MRIAVTGGTGLIGSALIRALQGRGDDVVALTRDPDRGRAVLGGQLELQPWPAPQEAPPPAVALDGADAVVHLLGEPVAQRWTEAAKREIRDSRVLTTRSLVAGLAALSDDPRPKLLVSQSAAGYYGPRGEEPLDESAPPGDDFLAGVTAAWEHEALAASPAVRVTVTRTGVVLSPSGGALARMLPPFRLGIGGPVAGGRQYVPWVHLDDVTGGLLHCLDHGSASGPVNLTAPNPATNAQLSHTLGRVLHRPAVLPVPGVALRLLYGEMASIILTGQRAIPARLQELGYGFRYTELEPALRDVLSA
jgi:uncharacterized protein (TIGR01777 family)